MQPPCGSPECPKPDPLFPQNVIPWKIWQTAHQFDRPTRTEFLVSMAGAQSLSVPMLLTSQVVDRLRSAYREPVETLERVLRLEVELYPLVMERWERNRERSDDGGGGDKGGNPWGDE